MHELGHTLGLRHGGGDDINCKPNYLSVMSYSRQFSDLIPDRPLDYSWVELPTLDEANLNEAAGIGVPVQTVFFVDTDGDGYNDGFRRVSVGVLPIDWNRDGDTDDTGVSTDLNSLVWGFDAHGNPKWVCDSWDRGLQRLKGYDDWSNLIYNFRFSRGFAHGEHPDVAVDEMTWEMVEFLQELVAPLPGVLQGRVVLQGRTAHSGVTITVGEDGLVASTSADGSFELEVPGGTYQVSVDKSGFLSALKGDVLVTAGQTTVLPDVVLLAGDADNSGLIDIFDLLIIANAFNTLPSDNPDVDINGDGRVDIFDLVLAGINFGKSLSPWPD
jgi:hypothetical protein